MEKQDYSLLFSLKEKLQGYFATRYELAEGKNEQLKWFVLIWLSTIAFLLLSMFTFYGWLRQDMTANKQETKQEIQETKQEIRETREETKQEIRELKKLILRLHGVKAKDRYTLLD